MARNYGARGLWLLTFSGLSAVLPVLAAAGENQGAPQLSLPLSCDLGRTCFIQSYVDSDPGPGVQDYACGSATYDGHKGTDFRLLSIADAEKKVAVLASADGTVKGTRDGMTDRLLRNQGAPEAVKNRECGNGVLVDHGNGWQTQYCHLLNGSVAVKTGDAVMRGQRLGDTGYSGAADFAHVHLEVRHNGQVIDPFSAQTQNASCSKDSTALSGLWTPGVAKALPYTNGQAINAGFAVEPPTLTLLEEQATPAVPSPSSTALVFFSSFINLRAGDQVRIRVSGPQGFSVDDTSKPLDRNKATWLTYGGKKRTLPAWPKGTYSGTASVLRDGTAIAEITRSFDLAQ